METKTIAAALAKAQTEMGKALKDSIITNPEARRYVLAIHGDGNRFLVGIRHDGGVDFGDGVTPDEAGMAFWKAFERAFIDVIADDCGVDFGGTE